MKPYPTLSQNHEYLEILKSIIWKILIQIRKTLWTKYYIHSSQLSLGP